MSIPNINPPYPDLSNGYIVTQNEWNGQFNAIFNYLNSTVKGAIDALQAAPPPTVGAQAFFGHRLTLESGVPVSHVDQANKTTMYLTPMTGEGALIGFYDPGTLSWSNATVGELSVAVPAGTRQLFNVFVRRISGVASLEIGSYKTLTASNNPAAGTSVVINVSNTADVEVGDIVSVVSGAGSEECYVTAKTLNTNITVDWLEFSHTSPTIGLRVPVDAVSLQDGVPVKDGDKSRRLVAIISTLASGQTSDTAAARCIGNVYNRVPRKIESVPSGGTFGFTATTLLPIGGVKTLGEYRILCVNPDYTVTQIAGIHARGGNAAMAIGMHINADVNSALGNFATMINQDGANANVGVPHGFNFMAGVRGRVSLTPMVTSSGVGSKTINNQASYNSQTLRIGYVTGTIMN